MPAFAFTVGSVGDFIALGDLIVRLGVALYRPGECTKDYQELLRELEQTTQILDKVKICKGQKMTLMAENCLKIVQIQVDSITRVIKEFLDKREQNSKGVWNKIIWVTNGSNEMADLRRTLSAHREMLSVCLEMLLSQQLSDVMALCEENVKDIQAIARSCPKQLTLVDAVGNYREISFDFCISYELFTDVLRAYYKHQGLPGHAFVARGDYQIISGDDYHVIEPPEWSIIIHPGSTVQMSMVLKRRGEITMKCPRCGAAPKDEGVSGWANWSVRWGRMSW
ncbi:hypothetical protein CPB86DRAFT_99513 [Serendipita vermifera]|nr:hypothetical protein CPB86DRAFT_99513 [Serendipita vermifera]